MIPAFEDNPPEHLKVPNCFCALLSRIFPQVVFSPYFLYNCRENQSILTLSVKEGWKIIEEIGCCTLETYPAGIVQNYQHMNDNLKKEAKQYQVLGARLIKDKGDITSVLKSERILFTVHDGEPKLIFSIADEKAGYWVQQGSKTISMYASDINKSSEIWTYDGPKYDPVLKQRQAKEREQKIMWICIGMCLAIVLFLWAAHQLRKNRFIIAKE